MKRFRAGSKRLPPLREHLAGVEASYTKRLVGLVTGWSARILAALGPTLRALPTAPERADARDPDSVIGRLRDRMVREADSAGRRAAQGAVRSIQSAGQDAANAQLTAVTGGRPVWRGVSAAQARVMDAAVARNVGLIRSIPEELLDQVQGAVREGLARGLHVEAFTALLQERFAVAESRARLIARDQVGKVAGQLIEARSRDIGVDDYVWRVSGSPNPDERVREFHRELDGSRQKFSNPPITDKYGNRNNPGEDFQCRCTAEPAVDALLDLLLAAE